MTSETQKILNLAKQFPSLAGKMKHWQPTEFDSIKFEKASRPWSGGERDAALFVIAVWNGSNLPGKGKGFDLVDATKRLSDGDRRVIIDWIQNPWWP